ncbi:MAG TPA: penicillin acylase family protein [Ktedonobacteraceae bacterium]|nr:penicillin acylase family protein [Ktedonobacteraceae bacterium]
MKQQSLLLRLLHLLAALLVAGGVIYVSTVGAGLLPALGSALNPGTGIWTAAGAARPVQSETLHFAGLQQPVTVIFEANGTPHIQAATDDDLFWTIGYLQARFRLTQMDLMRRQGEGHLAEILGKPALSSDQFQVMLGLDRAAQLDWQTLPANSAGRQGLQKYAQGVNARITEAEQSNSLPFMFKLLNYRPQPWTPLDTLVIQGEVTQDLDFSTTPLSYALLTRTLGYRRTMQWFPVLPSDVQHPYAQGPFQKAANLTPLPSQTTLSEGTMESVASIDQQIRALPGSMRYESASNNWAVNGPKAASGKALMAGDPHLHQTLPAIWYQLAASSPGYNFSGVSIPGVPLVLIGHNQHISWSMTDVQSESTLFYVEKTDQAHPHQYYWNGAWRQMKYIAYTIPVKGQATVHQDVYLTVHGPIFPADQGLPGETIAVDWMGALPSTDSEGLLDVLKAANFSQFRQALSLWDAPTLNFVYADDQGNIGMISPGYYPIVKSGAPWLPLPGTGEADIAGSIPYDAVPQVYNPPDHMVFTANQRPVGNDYPYFIGTTWGDFDNGYRANEIYSELTSKTSLTMQDMERMQNSTHDYLAGLIVPALLKALQQSTGSGNIQQATALLQNWNGNMDMNSPAASIWWTFWTHYLTDTFDPWWQAAHVPVAAHSDLAITPGQAPLNEDLEMWTLHDPTNAAFTLPDGTRRDASTVMLQAFQESVALLSKKLGNDPTQWQWGKLHTRQIDSLLRTDTLNYGPQAAGGDTWTLLAAGGSAVSQSDPTLRPSSHGPSWRIIVDWGSGQAEGSYPGGQDENPVSPWYENQITRWWNGQYYPMLDAPAARQQAGSVTWTLSK